MLGVEYDSLFRITLIEKNPQEHYIVMAKDLTEALERMWKAYPETKGGAYSAKTFYSCEVIKATGVIITPDK